MQIPQFNTSKEIGKAAITNSLPNFLKIQKRQLALRIIIILILICIVAFISGYFFAVKSANPISNQQIEFNGQIFDYNK